MSEPIETIPLPDGKIIKIFPDTDAESPREWDNLGQMVCWHRRYTLGDVQPDCTPSEWLAFRACELTPNPPRSDYIFLDNPEAAEACFDKHALRLPLYLYEHGGITMRCSPFPCPWDSGQVGWIWVSDERIQQEYGINDAQAYEWARKQLVAEVETYNHYLTGEVYGFVIEDENSEHLDSCWGFYGLDDCITEAKAVAHAMPEQLGLFA